METLSETTRVVYGQPSWTVSTPEVDLAVTVLGGHVGPVTFHLPHRDFEPYSIPPWHAEELPRDIPPVVRVLRGDFFCLPFGRSVPPFRDEEYELHGETANEPWSFEALERGEDFVRLQLEMTTRIWPGHVRKLLTLRAGQHALYQEHVLSGFQGPMTFGTHPNLKFGHRCACGLVSVSPFALGMTYPDDFEEPAQGGYSALKPACEFTSLEQVPLARGGMADLSRYPVNPGFEDVAMILADPSLDRAWTAVVFCEHDCLWLTLKDPKVLRGTLFWLSNGGRHYEPWRGRHTGVLGLEEATSFFGLGLTESVEPNLFSDRGFSTYVEMEPDRPLSVRTVTVVAPVEHGCGKVLAVHQERDAVVVEFEHAAPRKVAVDPTFVWPA